MKRSRELPFEELLDWMKAKGYFPNVWEVNDHGNASLYTATGRYLGGLV